MPVTPFAIEADHVSFSYGQQAVLDAVSFAIPEGSYVGIIGPNGGGKTTIIKIILGLLKPSSGSVSLFGKEPAEARLHGRVGYVPQRVAQADFSFPATVREIVRSGRVPKIGLGRAFGKEDEAAVQRAMDIAGVAHLAGRLIGTLSGGERQKAFIARSLASEPKLLVLDEPTTGVDVSAREQFYALLKKLNAEHKLTILLVSHDIEAITQEVSFVLALSQKLICHCSSHDFLTDETLKKLYGRDVELLHQHTH